MIRFLWLCVVCTRCNLSSSSGSSGRYCLQLRPACKCRGRAVATGRSVLLDNGVAGWDRADCGSGGAAGCDGLGAGRAGDGVLAGCGRLAD